MWKNRRIVVDRFWWNFLIFIFQLQIFFVLLKFDFVEKSIVEIRPSQCLKITKSIILQKTLWAKRISRQKSRLEFLCNFDHFWCENWNELFLAVTLFEIFIFCPEIQLWFPEKIVDFFFGWKTRENVVVLDFLAVDNFDFTRKIVK